MYSYFPTHSCGRFGKAGSLLTQTHRPAKSTSLCPFSGSDSFHLSVAQTVGPSSLMVCPAFATPPPKMRSTAGAATKSCLRVMFLSPIRAVGSGSGREPECGRTRLATKVCYHISPAQSCHSRRLPGGLGVMTAIRTAPKSAPPRSHRGASRLGPRLPSRGSQSARQTGEDRRVTGQASPPTRARPSY